MPGNPAVTRLWQQGFGRYARTAGWSVVTEKYAGLPHQKRKLMSLIRWLRPQGIVSSCHERISDGSLDGIPHVWLDAPETGVPAGDSLIAHDSSKIAEIAAKELESLGFGQYAVVGDDPKLPWSRRRTEVFVRCMKRCGRSVLVTNLSAPPFETLANLRHIERWLKTLPVPCGIFAVHDRIAALVMTAAHRLGLRIPWDLALVGVDNNEDICSFTTPPLTSIAMDWDEGGYMLASALEAAMRGRDAKPIRQTFGVLGIVRRASTASAASCVDARVTDARAYIREHACEGIGVDDVVRQMGCSRRLATMRYLEATGHSIHAEIREARLANVLVLLARRDVQIGAIADRCGWNSATALRAYFAKRLGMTMNRWRSCHATN